MNNFAQRIKQPWKSTARFRNGAKAGLQTGTLVASAVSSINAAPLPLQPDVTRTQQPAITREVEREGTKRLKSYGNFEINRLAAEQRQLVEDLPKRAAAERTARAAAEARSKPSASRSRGRGR